MTVFFFLLFFSVLFLVLLWQAVPVLLLFFAAVLIAVALRFVSDSFSRITGVPPIWSLTIILLLILLGTGAGFVVAAPELGEQSKEFIAGLHSSAKQLEETLRRTETGSWLIEELYRAENLTENFTGLWTKLAGIFGTTLGAITGFFLTTLVGLFLAYDPRLYIAGLLRLVPKGKRPRAGEIINELGYTLRWWMVGQLISMLVLFVTTWVMLWALGVPMAFALGLITGLLTFIPYLGPVIALVPIMMISFVQSPTLALWVLALYLVIQNLEANVLMPIIFKKTVHMPPALTVVAQVLLGGMLGFLGIILATPLMAAGIVLVKSIYVEDILGDDLRQPVQESPQ